MNEQEIKDIEVVGNVLPFKVNNYVLDNLIDWKNHHNDPIFRLTFPHRDMLSENDYQKMQVVLGSGASKKEIKEVANEIRFRLNPHPAGQLEKNVPEMDGQKLQGVQHKYRQTLLFFPSNGQTCHAYCTFCFRWPQFVGISDLKFASSETEMLVKYLLLHPEVTDILFTGGDPMIMKASYLRKYIEPLLDIPTVKNIRIGSKSLSYWPYRFTTDQDAEEILELFRYIRKKGKNLAFMAHFNHPVELKTNAVKEATKKILATGAQIRTQSPVMKHINDRPEAWREMWKKQVELGMIPYYMFLARDTGSHDYFAVPLVRAWKIFREAYTGVSGICRTVRGPSMSAGPGKIQLLGPTQINGRKFLAMSFIQGRDPDWVGKPFFAEYCEDATWIDELTPAFGKSRFFFEGEVNNTLKSGSQKSIDEKMSKSAHLN